MTNPPTDERRQAFEKWAISEGFTVEAFDKEKEKCFWPQTQLAWRAWQAALSHQGEVVASVELEGFYKDVHKLKGEQPQASEYGKGAYQALDWVGKRLTALISKAEKV